MEYTYLSESPFGPREGSPASRVLVCIGSYGCSLRRQGMMYPLSGASVPDGVEWVVARTG